MEGTRRVLAVSIRVTEWIRAIPDIARRCRSISFSQYSEDTIFYHLIPNCDGYYVDVGACHPSEASNTYKLYLRGWHGLTIEPNPDVAPLFRRKRPRDVHLSLGVATAAGELDYFRFDDPKLNSFEASQAATMQRQVRSTMRIPCLSLDEILSRYAPGRQIDLLSIDCEGRDLEVLRSLDLARWRPSVIAIEDFDQFFSSAAPRRESAIRKLLVAAGYALVAQAIFTAIYVDLQALDRRDEGTGFVLSRSQVRCLRP